ncbi:hypothetical protein Tco_0449866 [Tanacetum coccineum]
MNSSTIVSRIHLTNSNGFYDLVVKGNDLKTYIRRFQELPILCPNMVSNTVKLMKAFIGGLPQSIEGSVTASKPQTLEEAITITQRLRDEAAFFQVDILSARVDNVVLPYKRLSFDILLPLIRFPFMSSSPHSTIVPSDSDIKYAIPPPQVIIALPAVLPPPLVLSLSPMLDCRDFFPSE